MSLRDEMGQEQGSPCPPPHTPTLSRGAPSPRLPTLPAWRRQGHQAQGVCHLLFIDCHGLHCQGRPDAQERTAERKEEGGRSERRGLLGARHTGLQATALGGQGHRDRPTARPRRRCCCPGQMRWLGGTGWRCRAVLRPLGQPRRACVPQEDRQLSNEAGMAVTPTNWPVLGSGSP